MVLVVFVSRESRSEYGKPADLKWLLCTWLSAGRVFCSPACHSCATLVGVRPDFAFLPSATTAVQVMGHMAVPMVLKNTNVRGATHEAPLTGERAITRDKDECWWIEKRQKP